jgi:hypothetical protein
MIPAESIALWRHQLEIYGELRLSPENARRLMSYAEMGAERLPDATDLRQPELPLLRPHPNTGIVKLIAL